MMQADVIASKIENLKKVIADRVVKQLALLKKGHPYKSDEDLNTAVDIVELYETGCFESTSYLRVLDYYSNKLQR